MKFGVKQEKKPKTFEIDTNTYQRIGDVQYSWNESRKRSGHIKESKIACDKASVYQFQLKLLEFFDNYLGDPIVKAKTIKGDMPKPFTYREWNDRGSDFYEVSLFGEYEDDVVIELRSVMIGGGCSYKLLTGDGSECEYWTGMSLDEFEKDLSECFKIALSNEGRRITEGKKRIEESASWKNKFEQKIKQRVVRIFQDWVDEDNAQGMVDDFDINPDNAVEELINEILENEADEIHEGRYEDFLYTIMDEEDINQKEIEKVGEAYLDKLEDLNIEEKRKTFGKSYCNKLEKQMQYVSAFGDEDED